VALALVILGIRAVERRRRPTRAPILDPAVLRARALVGLCGLADESGGAFIPAYKLVVRLGQSPGLPVVLETLLHEGLTEWGPANDGGWGQRPTAAGYEEAAIVLTTSRRHYEIARE
jgi:hypothetical protein